MLRETVAGDQLDHGTEQRYPMVSYAAVKTEIMRSLLDFPVTIYSIQKVNKQLDGKVPAKLEIVVVHFYIKRN